MGFKKIKVSNTSITQAKKQRTFQILFSNPFSFLTAVLGALTSQTLTLSIDLRLQKAGLHGAAHKSRQTSPVLPGLRKLGLDATVNEARMAVHLEIDS